MSKGSDSMNHEDHIALLGDGITGPGGVWADLGSGSGAFTLALADLLGPSARIYSVDRDERALLEQQRAMRARFPDRVLTYRAADFTQPLDLPPLDGVVMANSLHFQRNKDSVLQLVRGYLRPHGRLILVEYNADHGNPWVPYPLAYATWEALARANGLVETRLLATRPSRFLREIYSAVSLRGDTDSAQSTAGEDTEAPC
jgi:ubiquinone/menaquinone biosynthesis C-methylase UbiE